MKRLRPSILARLTAKLFGGQGMLLPDSLVEEMGDERHFHAHLCTEAGLHEACDLTRGSYGSAYVTHEIAEQWRLRNPFAFVQIMNSENRLCACFGVVALRQSFMDQFIKGRVSDQQLRGDDICDWAESKLSTQLYVSGVVVLEPHRQIGHKRAVVMLWAMLQYIRQLYDLRIPRQLYAVAVTEESGRLMKNLGFKIETPALHRNDKRDLYRYDLTETSWNKLLCEINDCSRMCDLDLTIPALIKIVFVAGDRGGSRQHHVQFTKELDAIEESIKSCTHRAQFDSIRPIFSATHPKLVEAYSYRPTILHFAGHGDDRSLSLYMDRDLLVEATPITAERLAAVLRDFPPVRLCVLNTCNSESVAKHLVDEHVVDAAIGWRSFVTDATAVTFSKALYRLLGNSVVLSQSVRLAAESCVPLATPVLHAAVGINPDTYVLLERARQ